MAQAAWVGPMLGQHTYFRIQPSEAGSHAATRYRDQARRVFEVLDRHLSTRDWLAAGRYTLADVATYPWVGSLTGLGFDWNDYRSEEHTSELQSLMRISYAVLFLKKQTPYRTMKD